METLDKAAARKALRKEKIAAREALSPEERAEKSRAICTNILQTPEYAKAKTVFIYKFVKGEVQLKALEESLKAEIPTAQAELEPGHSGFGMRNVDLRIRLYYKKQTGLLVQSGSEGTSVSFTIPIRTREEIDNDESLSRG